jgi:hypothetical protein
MPSHAQVNVEFDLYVIRSWDGNQVDWPPEVYGPQPLQLDYIVGPDQWAFQADGQTLLQTTFANWDVFRQAYPGPYPGGDYPALTGATAINTLGYKWGPAPMDAVYHMIYSFDHTSDTLELKFAGSGLTGGLDESWGLDNVKVTIFVGGSTHQLYMPILIH